MLMWMRWDHQRIMNQPRLYAAWVLVGDYIENWTVFFHWRRLYWFYRLLLLVDTPIGSSVLYAFQVTHTNPPKIASSVYWSLRLWHPSWNLVPRLRSFVSYYHRMQMLAEALGKCIKSHLVHCCWVNNPKIQLFVLSDIVTVIKK